MKQVHLQILVAVLCFCPLIRTSAQQQIRVVLDEIDSNVKDIASQASANVAKICESLPLCTQQTCSRQPCNPLGKYEIQNLKCISVDLNPDCSGSCQQSVRVSANQSYIRLPPLASESDYEFRQSMCAQKPVGRKLVEVWQNSGPGQNYHGWVFFGTVEGFMYTFPGRDYVDDLRCVDYDPRTRPWYTNALAVVKSVHILIDTSGSMANRVGPLSLQSCLDVSQGIVSGLLNTLTNEDRVALSDLNGVSIGTSVNVSLEGVSTSQDQAEIVALKDSMKNLKVQNQITNFKAGLSGALQFFSSSTNKDLKILLIFSNGQFVSSLNFTELAPVFKQLGEENVVVFFYQTGAGDSSNANSLHALSSSLNTTLEVVKDGDNPLFKVRSYFDYLAWLRFQSVNKAPIWVPIFADNSGFGNVTTSTFPAFDINGRLIGVAGIDLIANRFINTLGFRVIQDAVSERSPGPSHLQTFTAPQVKQVLNSTNCPQQSNLSPVCSRLDTSTPMLDFICCNGSNCSANSKESDDTSSSSWSTPAIAGVSVGGAAGLVILALLSFWAYKRCTRTQPTDNKPHQPQENRWDWLTPDQTPSQ